MSKSGEKKTTKAAFVRAIPDSVPAKEVVAKAKAAGITISEKHVYVIRSGARKKAGKGSAEKTGRTRADRAPTSSDEASFRKLVLALGIPKSKAIVADVERKLNELIYGR